MRLEVLLPSALSTVREFLPFRRTTGSVEGGGRNGVTSLLHVLSNLAG